ncbi:MAG: hypothetical protein Q7T46_08735 [Polaromonas sp.]|nr:hypothetical protein [Polaromonas sp.]
MKFVFTAPFIAIGLLAGCASSPAVPPGMMAGKFVSFSCEGGKTFSARAAEDGKTVRVRGHHGSAELDMKSDGVYEGDGYTLMTKGADGVSLMHSGKPEGKSCKPA